MQSYQDRTPPGDCRDWYAWHNRQPPGPQTLYVTGVCTVPDTGWTVELRRHEPQGINPKVLLLDLVVRKSETYETTAVSVRYEEATDFIYDAVTILPDGPSIPVEVVD
jgi:hypothetical protein